MTTALYAKAMPLIKAIGRKYMWADREDVLGDGAVGLAEAISRYDSSRGSIVSFAWPRIVGAIKDGIKRRTACGHEVSTDPRTLDGFDSWDIRTDSMAAKRVRAAVRELPSRDRQIVIRHIWRGEDLCKIASSLGISKSWASIIYAKSLRSLRRTLSSQQITGCDL